MKKLIGLSFVLVGLSSLAAPSVNRMLLRQQWPWYDQVRVDFEVTGATAPVDVTVSATADGEALDTAALQALVTGERFALKNGRHALAFDPASLIANANKVKDLRVELSLVASSASMSDALYKIIDLESGTVEDVSVGSLLSGRYGAVVLPDENVSAGGAVTTASYVWTGVTNDVKYATDYLVLRKVYAKGVSWTTGAGTSGSPKFSVSLTNDFYAGVFQFTQGQWKKLMGSYPASYFNGEGVRDRRPVEYLAYPAVRGDDLYPARPADSTVFGVLRQRSGLSVDLPGEFQWEWMALSGTGNLNTGYNTGVASSVVDKKDANYPGRYQYNGGCVDGATVPVRTCGPENGTAYVGSYAPSKWGFYDCHGNVNEMCLDYYEARTTIKDLGGIINVNPTDPTKTYAGETPTGHIARGGHWRTEISYISSAACMPLKDGYNNYGFRVFLNVYDK